MIGLGTWKTTVHHSFYDGDIILAITDNNGEYAFDVTLKAFKEPPTFEVSNITEKGNRLEGDVKISIIPFKIKFYADFEADVMRGALNIPFVGEIKIDNAVRID